MSSSIVGLHLLALRSRRDVVPIISHHSLSLIGLGLLLGACDPGPARLRVAAYGEPFIENGIPADVFVDGWQVDFDRYLVALSEVEADGQVLDGAFVVDLTQPSQGAGHELGALTLPAGGRPVIGYRIAPVAEATAVSATDEDVAWLIERGASIWMEGRAVKDGRMVSFAWELETDTGYLGCESTAELVGGRDARSRLTIHADHLFLDDLDSEEPNVAFDLIASADRNQDGEVTVNELWETDISSQARYQVGSRDEIIDLWSFMLVLAENLGHIDGEGHCETSPAP
jgi:hypothetical protein